MNNEIIVSICCFSYNQEKYLQDTINSFLLQKTNFRYEIIIHDDASTDNSALIIHEFEKKYSEKIRGIYEKKNIYSTNPSKMTDLVFSTCKGRYIALCDGDDQWINKNKLQ